MQLLHENEARRRESVAVFREAPHVHLGWPIALFVAGVFLLILVSREMIHPVLVWIAAFCFVFFLFTLYAVAPVLKPTNWLVKLTPDGVLVNFRSYINAHLPEPEPTVAFIPNSEISGVRETLEKRVNHMPQGGRQINRYTHIELILNGADTTPLEAALRAERKDQGPLSYTRRGKISNYPVTVPEPGVVRIAWKGQDTAIAPKVKEAIALLESRFAVHEPGEYLNDYANRERHEELENLLWEYCRRGKAMQAVQVARERYGYTIGEATMYVEEIMREVRTEKKSG